MAMEISEYNSVINATFLDFKLLTVTSLSHVKSNNSSKNEEKELSADQPGGLGWTFMDPALFVFRLFIDAGVSGLLCDISKKLNLP